MAQNEVTASNSDALLSVRTSSIDTSSVDTKPVDSSYDDARWKRDMRLYLNYMPKSTEKELYNLFTVGNVIKPIHIDICNPFGDTISAFVYYDNDDVTLVAHRIYHGYLYKGKRITCNLQLHNWYVMLCSLSFYNLVLLNV